MIDGVKHYSFATTTCFGAASSADVFHDVGSAAEFILRCATGNVVIVRYADDFLVLIPPLDSSPAHAQAMAARDRIIDVCDALGLPIAKFEGPAFSSTSVCGDRHRHHAHAGIHPARARSLHGRVASHVDAQKTRTRARNTIPRGAIVLRGTSRSVGQASHSGPIRTS